MFGFAYAMQNVEIRNNSTERADPKLKIQPHRNTGENFKCSLNIVLPVQLSVLLEN